MTAPHQGQNKQGTLPAQGSWFGFHLGSRADIMAFLLVGTPLAGHLYLRPALHYFAPLDRLDDPVPRDLLLDWISGQRAEGNQELDAALRALARTSRAFRSGPRIYALKDFQPWAHVYAHLLGGLALLARRVGFAGLVVGCQAQHSVQSCGRVVGPCRDGRGFSSRAGSTTCTTGWRVVRRSSVKVTRRSGSLISCGR